jgi:hypothetical protein
MSLKTVGQGPFESVRKGSRPRRKALILFNRSLSGG